MSSARVFVLEIALALVLTGNEAYAQTESAPPTQEECAKDIAWAEAQTSLKLAKMHGVDGEAQYAATEKHELAEIHSAIGEILRRMSQPAAGATDDPRRRYADNVGQIPPLMRRAKCWDPATEALWIKRATSIVEKVRLEAVAADKNDQKCKNDPTCSAGRILERLCPALDQRAEVDGNLKENLRYAKRTGVINLDEQNDLSDQLKDLDREIANLKTDYKTTMHKAFSTAVCSGR